MPEWYPLVQAARFLKIAPWELEEHEDGLFWQQVAIAAANAEYHAEAMKNKAR